MRIAICAGKTGGHFFPALAVARLLKSQSTPWKIFFIGTKGGLDEGLLHGEGFQFESISGCGLPAKLNWKVFKWFFCFLKGLWKMVGILRRRKPDVVLAFGGYISVAPVLVAHWMKIPIVIHEANIHPGRANRFLAKWAQAICTTFPMTECASQARKSKTRARCKERHHVTGLPIRQDFLAFDCTDSFDYFKLDPQKFTVLVMGGSLGSRRINECLLEALHELGDVSAKTQILHITGQKDYERVMSQYRPNGVSYQAFSFMEKVEHAFKCADLFVGRAGASTIAEITYCGLPAILIPYPHAIENHQAINAQYLVREGAACLIRESELSGKVLAREVIRLIEDLPLRESLASNSRRLGILDGAERMVQVLEKVIA